MIALGQYKTVCAAIHLVQPRLGVRVAQPCFYFHSLIEGCVSRQAIKQGHVSRGLGRPCFRLFGEQPFTFADASEEEGGEAE